VPEVDFRHRRKIFGFDTCHSELNIRHAIMLLTVKKKSFKIYNFVVSKFFV